MAANSPFLRPLGIAAGVLGTVQAITWGVLSLLGILLYTDNFKWEPSKLSSDQFEVALVAIYFQPLEVANFTDLNIMTPETVVIWTSIYLATSVIWLGISGFLLYDSYKSRFTSKAIIGWVAVSAVVAAIDFAGTVTFGVDYNSLQSKLDITTTTSPQPATSTLPSPSGTDFRLAPIFMMIMCARGFILWIINVGLAIYLGVAVRKLCKKDSPNYLKDPDYSSRHPSFNSPYYNSVGASTYSSPNAGSISHGRQNPAFQPDPIHEWDTQPPTVGNQQPNQRDFHQKNSFHPDGVVNPIQPIPRAGKPAPVPVDPRPTPQPDYSPPPPRQKHEPNLYEAPARSVLKKSNSQRQLYF